jgi:hypothetical protein
LCFRVCRLVVQLFNCFGVGLGQSHNYVNDTPRLFLFCSFIVPCPLAGCSCLYQVVWDASQFCERGLVASVDLRAWARAPTTPEGSRSGVPSNVPSTNPCSPCRMDAQYSSGYSGYLGYCAMQWAPNEVVAEAQLMDLVCPVMFQAQIHAASSAS